MKCAIMQPTYIPWLGYFDLIDQVDKFVFLDNVKLEKSSWQVRNRIKTRQGELYLTIPVNTPQGRMHTLINETLIDNKQPWQEKHLKSITHSYKDAAFFNEVFSFLERLLTKRIDALSPLNIAVIKEISAKLGIATQFIKASDLAGITGVRELRIVSICKTLGCEYYLSPIGASGYIEKYSPGGQLVKNGLQLYYQNYEHPIYSQLYGTFTPFMSVIDLFFNCGFLRAREIIKSGRRDPLKKVK